MLKAQRTTEPFPGFATNPLYLSHGKLPEEVYNKLKHMLTKAGIPLLPALTNDGNDVLGEPGPKDAQAIGKFGHYTVSLMWFIQSLRDGNEKQRYSYLLFGSRYLVGAVVGCSSELSPNERHIIHSAVLAEGGSTEVGRPGPTTTHFVIPQDNYDIKDIEIATAVQYMATGLQIVIPPFFTHHLPHKMLNTDTTPYLKLSTSRAFSGGTLSHWMHEQIVLLFEIYLGEPGKKFWNSADPEHHGSRDFGICWNCSEAGEIVPSRDGKESCCASCYSRAPNGIFCCICRSVGPDLRRRDNRTICSSCYYRPFIEGEGPIAPLTFIDVGEEDEQAIHMTPAQLEYLALKSGNLS